MGFDINTGQGPRLTQKQVFLPVSGLGNWTRFDQVCSEELTQKFCSSQRLQILNFASHLKCDAWKCGTFSGKQIWPKNYLGTACVGRNTEQVNVFTGWQTVLERCWTFYFDWRNFLIAIVCQSEAEEWIFGIRKILKIIPHRPLLGILQPCLRILLPSSLLLSNNVNTFTSANIILLLRIRLVRPRRLECYSQCLDLTAFSPFSLVLNITQ